MEGQTGGEDVPSQCCDSPQCDPSLQAGHFGKDLKPEAQPPASVPECPICFSAYDEAFRTPLQLPSCGHTFCLVCLSRMSLFPSQPHGFQCPLCRTPVLLPPGGAPCLPPNTELVSRLPQGSDRTLKRVWLEGFVLCHWTGTEGGGATGVAGVARLPLVGAPAVREGQPIAMVTVHSRRRVGSCRNIRGSLGLLSFLLFIIIIFIAIFLPVYLRR